MSSRRYEAGTFGLPPTLFMPTWPSADQLFNLTGFFNLIDQVVTTQQQLVLSYVTFGTRIAESLRDVHHDWSRALSDDSIRARAYQLYQQRDRQPGDALDDWSRARAELQDAAR